MNKAVSIIGIVAVFVAIAVSPVFASGSNDATECNATDDHVCARQSADTEH